MTKLIINGRLDALNDYTRACRANKFLGAKMKQKNEDIISLFIVTQLKDVHFKKVRLTFHWYEQDKKRDLDNICFAKKFILDALVKNNVIEADNWKGVVGFNDFFYVDKENPRIEVEIQEVGD